MTQMRDMPYLLLIIDQKKRYRIYGRLWLWSFEEFVHEAGREESQDECVKVSECRYDDDAEACHKAPNEITDISIAIYYEEEFK